MSSENPYEPSSATNANPTRSSSDDTSKERAAYNVVSDTVIGLNARRSDNRFQAIFIAISALLFAVVGIVLAFVKPEWDVPWFAGALIGGFAGVVVGLFASGIFLMIYRAKRHLEGKHD